MCLVAVIGVGRAKKGRMKYDDASWHYGGNFPRELPDAAGATHIGMFLAWALLNGLAGEIHLSEFPQMLEKLETRAITPGQFLVEACDEKFTNEDLNEEGNLFAQDYYRGDHARYLSDYEKALGKNVPTLYHVPDTWESFDRLAPVIAARFNKWQKRQNAKWWQVWK